MQLYLCFQGRRARKHSSGEDWVVFTIRTSYVCHGLNSVKKKQGKQKIAEQLNPPAALSVPFCLLSKALSFHGAKMHILTSYTLISCLDSCSVVLLLLFPLSIVMTKPFFLLSQDFFPVYVAKVSTGLSDLFSI